MKMERSHFFIISLLGAFSVISPFAIDMYLPAYFQVAQDLHVAIGKVPLTLSSYFVGLAGGQIFYGPLLDRFGRKPPLTIGLLLFIAASMGCALSTNIYVLMIFRFIQALGGCGAQVASLAIVNDFFPVNKAAKIFSRLFLFIAVSPLLAPSTGGWISLVFGWQAVFILLALIVCVITLITHFYFPETHRPDPTISLSLKEIALEYGAILKFPHFTIYAFSGSLSLCGLFLYVAGSPLIFMYGFHLSAKIYAAIFAFLATGFIGGSQLNAYLLNKLPSETLFFSALSLQVITNLMFVAGTAMHLYGLGATLVFFFVSLGCAGMTTPNGAALAMSQFSKNAGSAAAMLGFIRYGIGSLVAGSIGLFGSPTPLSIISILAMTSLLGLMIFFAGRRSLGSSGSSLTFEPKNE